MRLPAAAALAALAGCASPSAPDAVAQPGANVADVAVRDFSGRSVTLGELAPRRTVVVVWASWCAPCLQELPQLEADRAALAARGIDVVLVSTEGRAEPPREALAERGIGIPCYLAPGGTSGPFVKRFGFRGVPDGIVLGPGAVLERNRIGPYGWKPLLR